MLLAALPNGALLLLGLLVVLRWSDLRRRLAQVRADAAAAPPAGEAPWRLTTPPPGATTTHLADRTLVALPARFRLLSWVVVGLALPVAALPVLLGVEALRGGARTPGAFGGAGLGLLVAYAVVAMATRFGERVVLVDASTTEVRLGTSRPLLPGRVLTFPASAGLRTSGAPELRRGEPDGYVLTLSRGRLALGDKLVFDDAALGAWLDGALQGWHERASRRA